MEEANLLRSALAEYADERNWADDGEGVRRVWLEPGAKTPDRFNGFEAAQKALQDKPAELTVIAGSSADAFAAWVANVPLHERTPYNVWHAAAAWKGSSNGKASS